MSEPRKKITLPYLFNKVETGEPIIWLTCCDYPTAFLQGLLNSKLIHFYLSLIAETSGMGVNRWIRNYVIDVTQTRLCGSPYCNIHVAFTQKAPKSQDESCGTSLTA